MNFTSTAAAALLAATACLQPALASAERAEPPVQLAAAAETDDASFLFLMALLEGHLQVGHDLIQAGKQRLALPHFGHPVRELYDEIKGELAARHVPAFDGALIDLEAQVIKEPTGAKTEADYQNVIAALHKARETVPAETRNSVPAVAQLCANIIQAAAGEYGESLEKGRIENVVEYHDSRGFISFAAAEIDRVAAASPTQAELVAKLKAVLAKAQAIVGPLMPPERPIKSVADYRAVAEEAAAITKR